MGQIIPVPKMPLNIRVATGEDIPFMDGLQKKHSRQLGFFPRAQMEGYVAGGHVLIAEAMEGEVMNDECGMMNERRGDVIPAPPFITHHSSLRTSPVGYLISRDRYLKRDELGVVYQLCVTPEAQRGLVGASLLRAAFERAAYGCRLFCCWCAQDIEANRFWESMGFVPLAFRAGGGSQRSKGKRQKGGRVHIFWQKRICEGDAETKWWYPFQTNAGAIRADRVVFPIPAGVSWRDVQPIEVPGTGENPKLETRNPNETRITKDEGLRTRAKRLANPKSAIENPKSTLGPPAGKVGILVGGRIKYVDRPGWVKPAEESTTAIVGVKGKRERSAKPRAEKIDPAFLAKVRELRDRYLEHVNAGESVLAPSGKYHIVKTLGAATRVAMESMRAKRVRMLPAA